MRLVRKLFPEPIKPTPAEIQSGLMTAFSFTDADLQENRQGRMSKEQHYWFVDRLLRQFFLNIAGILFIGWMFIDSLAHPFQLGGPAWSGFWTIGLAAALFVLVLGTISQAWAMLIDCFTYKIDSISGGGKVRWVKNTFGRGGFRILDVEGAHFDIPEKARSAIIDGEIYTVYYARRSKTILAIEAM